MLGLNGFRHVYFDRQIVVIDPLLRDALEFTRFFVFINADSISKDDGFAQIQSLLLFGSEFPREGRAHDFRLIIMMVMIFMIKKELFMYAYN